MSSSRRSCFPLAPRRSQPPRWAEPRQRARAPKPEPSRQGLRLGVPSSRRPSPRRPLAAQAFASEALPRRCHVEASAPQPELRGQFPAARSRRQIPTPALRSQNSAASSPKPWPRSQIPKPVRRGQGSVALEVSLSLGPERGRGSSAVRLDPARRPGASLPGGPAQQTILGEPGDGRPSPPSACGASMRNRTLAPTRQRGNGSRVSSSIQAPRESHPHR